MTPRALFCVCVRVCVNIEYFLTVLSGVEREGEISPVLFERSSRAVDYLTRRGKESSLATVYGETDRALSACDQNQSRFKKKKKYFNYFFRASRSLVSSDKLSGRPQGFTQ